MKHSAKALGTACLNCKSAKWIVFWNWVKRWEVDFPLQQHTTCTGMKQVRGHVLTWELLKFVHRLVQGSKWIVRMRLEHPSTGFIFRSHVNFPALMSCNIEMWNWNTDRWWILLFVFNQDQQSCEWISRTDLLLWKNSIIPSLSGAVCVFQTIC